MTSMVKLTSGQIEDWVARNFPGYKRKSSGRQLVLNNPFDGDDGHHLWISTVEAPLKRPPHTRGFWVHDFRPGHWNSSFIRFVRTYKNCSYFEAIADICGQSKQKLRDVLRRTHIEQQENEPQGEIEKEVELPKLSRPFTDESFPTARKHALNYLKGRQISEEQIQKHMLHYTPSSIVFPYIEYGVLVFWQEREILHKRFAFPDEAITGLLKTDYLYNFDNVEPGDYVGVVESIFNSISLGDNCTASGGAVIAGRQINKLKALHPKMLVLAPDNDDAGMKSIKMNFFTLRNDFKLVYSLPPRDIKDWNDMDKLHGAGAARRYFEDNVQNLTLSVMMRLQQRYVTVS